MSIRVEKCFFDLNQAMDSAGILTTLEVPYLVFEVEDESTALIAVREAAPSTYQNLKLNTIEIDERINKDTFKVRALYEINVFGDGS